MLSNLEIIGWETFRGLPKLDEAVKPSPMLAVRGIVRIQFTLGPNAPKFDHLDKLCFSCIFLHQTWQLTLDCCPICLNLKIDTKCEIMTS